MMLKVSVTDLRNSLPSYLTQIQQGAKIAITSHGKIIASIIPYGDIKRDARSTLEKLRKSCHIGDVTSPIDTEWHSKK